MCFADKEPLIVDLRQFLYEVRGSLIYCGSECTRSVLLTEARGFFSGSESDLKGGTVNGGRRCHGGRGGARQQRALAHVDPRAQPERQWQQLRRPRGEPGARVGGKPGQLASPAEATWGCDTNPKLLNFGSRDQQCGQRDSTCPVACSDKQLPDICVQETDRILVEKSCWDTALDPLKQLPMNLFIMYMAGNTISILPIMMVCMMAWRPIQALMSMSARF
ncbi:uncharacterized protein LOC144484169 [Mustelus asterias]